MDFTEYDGMILLARTAAGGREWSVADKVRELKDRGRWRSKWQFERAENHLHARMSLPDREHVRAELQIATEFRAALRETFPDRRFVISHILCYAVSFYQATEGAPQAGVEQMPKSGQWRGVPEGMVFCSVCEKAQPFRGLASPDAEFPFVEWGVCDECARDCMLTECEVRTSV